MYVYRMMRSERVTRGISFALVESSSRLLTESRVLSVHAPPSYVQALQDGDERIYLPYFVR